MDRLKKHMPDSVRDRIDPPKSYAGSSDSRTSIRRTPTEPAEEKGTLGKLKGMVPGRIVCCKHNFSPFPEC